MPRSRLSPDSAAARPAAPVDPIDAFLTQVFNNLSSGLHLQDLGAQAAIPTRSTSNLANKLGLTVRTWVYFGEAGRTWSVKW